MKSFSYAKLLDVHLNLPNLPKVVIYIYWMILEAMILHTLCGGELEKSRTRAHSQHSKLFTFTHGPLLSNGLLLINNDT